MCLESQCFYMFFLFLNKYLKSSASSVSTYSKKSNWCSVPVNVGVHTHSWFPLFSVLKVSGSLQYSYTEVILQTNNSNVENETNSKCVKKKFLQLVGVCLSFPIFTLKTCNSSVSLSSVAVPVKWADLQRFALNLCSRHMHMSNLWKLGLQKPKKNMHF